MTSVAEAIDAASLKAGAAVSLVDTGACVTAVPSTPGVYGHPRLTVAVIADAALIAPKDGRAVAVPKTTAAKARSRLKRRRTV